MHPLQNRSIPESPNTYLSVFTSLPRSLHGLFSSCTGARSEPPTPETRPPEMSLATVIETFPDSSTRGKLFLAAQDLWGNESLDQPPSFTRRSIIQELGKKDPAQMEDHITAAKSWHKEAPHGAIPDCWTLYFLMNSFSPQEALAIEKKGVDCYKRFITTFPEELHTTPPLKTTYSFFKLLNVLHSFPTEDQYGRFLSAISAISTSLTPPEKKVLMQSLDKLCLSDSGSWTNVTRITRDQSLEFLESIAEIGLPNLPAETDLPIFQIRTLFKEIKGPDALSHTKAVVAECNRLLTHAPVGSIIRFNRLLTRLSGFSDRSLRERFVSAVISLGESTKNGNKSKFLVYDLIQDLSESLSGNSSQLVGILELTSTLIRQLYADNNSDASAITMVRSLISGLKPNLRDQFVEVVRIRHQLLNQNPLSSTSLREILNPREPERWSQETSKYMTSYGQAFDMVTTLSKEQRILEAEEANYLSTFTRQLYDTNIPSGTQPRFIEYVIQACRLLPANSDFTRVIAWMAKGPNPKIEDVEGRLQKLNRRRAAQGEGVHEGSSDDMLRSAIQKFCSVALEQGTITEALKAFESYLEKYPKVSDRELALRALSQPKIYTEDFPHLLDPQGFTILGLPLQGSSLIGRLWLFISQLPDERDQENAKVSMVSALKDSYESKLVEQGGINAEVLVRVCNQGKTRRLFEGVLSGRLEASGTAPIEHKVLENGLAVTLFFQNEAHQKILDWDELMKTAEEFVAKNPMVEKEGFINKIKEFAAQGDIFQRTEISVVRFWETAEHRGIDDVELLAAAANTFCHAHPEVEKEPFMTAVKEVLLEKTRKD